jgi:predicted metalloprotease
MFTLIFDNMPLNGNDAGGHLHSKMMTLLYSAGCRSGTLRPESSETPFICHEDTKAEKYHYKLFHYDLVAKFFAQNSR